jgi:hypothetical protein
VADTLQAALWKATKHHHARPWLALAAEVPATFASHQAWEHSPMAAVGLTIATGALTAATWWAGHGTSAHRRLHATATTALAGSYVVVGTYVAPLSSPMLSTLAIGGATLAASWSIRKTLRVNPDTKQVERGHSETGVLVKAIGNAKAALRGAPKIEPNKVTAQLQLSGGEVSTDELGNRIKHIAGELGVSPTSIRIVPDSDRADRTTMVITPVDMLTEGTPWPGPSSFGGSIAEPVINGLYEDGSPLQRWYPADERTHRNATHFLTAGMNGSGKSAGQTLNMVEVLTRRDVILWGVDPSKGLQTFGPLLPYMDWAELTLKGGEAVVAALGPVITARADALGRHGYKNWTEEAFAELGMPYMVVWFEEAAKFFREGTEMEGMVQEARSAGISIILSLQRPSATSMPTDVREQLGGAEVFGVKGSTTADMCLPEDVRDAGARPEVWQNRKPGYQYLVAPGVDEERYAMKARTFIPPTDAEIEGALSLAPRPAAGSITATAAGPDYANRTIYQPGTDLTSTDTGPLAEGDDSLLDASVERDLRLEPGEDDGSPVPEVDADRQIPPPTAVFTFGQASPVQPRELGTEEALAEVLALLDEFRDEGRAVIGPKDFKPHLNAPGHQGRIGRSRAWLSPLLADLADQGQHLQDTGRPGEYTLLHPQLAGV